MADREIRNGSQVLEAREEPNEEWLLANDVGYILTVAADGQRGVVRTRAVRR